MLSKTQSKYIRSLSQQKYRNENNVFLAEGDKIAVEWLSSDKKIQMIVAVQLWADEHSAVIKQHPEAELLIVEQHELEKVSTLQTPNQVLLVVHRDAPLVKKLKWAIGLDRLQDPGNMGTIIRIADWFSIDAIIASPDSVDFYNPKVVQAAMGGHLRVQLITEDLITYIKRSDLPVYAATLEGDNIYQVNKPENGIILIGNESKGLSDELIRLADNKVTIPKMGGAESLNAAVSTGILIALLTGS